MSISVQCECGKALKVKEGSAGKRVKCPGCGSPVPVPRADDDEDAPVGVQDDGSGQCRSCGALMAARAVLCIKCGYNTKTGKKVKSKVAVDAQHSRQRAQERQKGWKSLETGLGLLNILGFLAPILIILTLLSASANLRALNDAAAPRSALAGREIFVGLIAAVVLCELVSLIGYYLCWSAPIRQGRMLVIAAMAAVPLCVSLAGLMLVHPMFVWAWLFCKSVKMCLFLFFLSSVAKENGYHEQGRQVITALSCNALVWCGWMVLFGLGMMAGAQGSGSPAGNILFAVFIFQFIAFVGMGISYMRALRDISSSVYWKGRNG